MIISSYFTKKQKLDNPLGKSNETAVIMEIHNTFFTEVDRLLEQAKISKSLDTNMQDAIDKAAKLKTLGFENTKECKLAKAEIERLNNIKVENENKVELNKAILYFKNKYPLYKFITEKSVIEICEKYGLIYGEVSKYIGDVPDKNLQEMLNFKIGEEDKVYFAIQRFVGSRDWQTQIPYYEFLRRKNESEKQHSYDIHTSYGIEPLTIVAPINDFDTTGMDLRNFKLVNKINDPIVLQPVMYNNNKYFLIQTAWGAEASDSEVVNPIMN